MTASAMAAVPRYEDLPELITVEEFATFLRISRNGAYELCRTNAVPTLHFGRLIRIKKSALLEGTK
jgi:excisionase family DNA binding protein